MKDKGWVRQAQVSEIAADVWRYLTAAVVEDEKLLLEAQALFGMSRNDVRTLGAVHLVLSEQVGALLAGMPRLIRRLATTTVRDEEVSPERVRGAIRWGPTLTGRVTTGRPNLFVTSPSRRAFQTPENQVLVAALGAVSTSARRTGWHRSSGHGVGAKVRGRAADAERWLRHRSLTEVESRPIAPRTRSQVRTGRARRRYQPAVEVLDLHRKLLRRSDRSAIRSAVEQHALLVATNDKLLELRVAFAIERALGELGWALARPGLIGGGPLFAGTRLGRRITVYYDAVPRSLALNSAYRQVQEAHSFPRVGGLRPDFVLAEGDGATAERWVLVEVKGVESSVDEHARRAIRDLLAYRRAFDPVLSGQASPYGLAVAWGSGVTPSTDAEIAVCSPDTVVDALSLLLPD